VFTLYGFLMREGRIPTDWFARQVAFADRTEGDIDTLSNRIAQVRTWTFVANRLDWLADPEHWQGVTRAVEDKLSDALHEQLALRFVDRRISVLMRRLRENTTLDTAIGKTGDVVVEGHVVGHLQGFEFAPDPAAGGTDAKALRAAAQKALAGEIESRARKLSESPPESFVLAADGVVRWTGEAVARLVSGENALEPRLRILADEQLTGAAREAVQARLDLWLKSHIEKLLGPLTGLAKAEDVSGIARGVAFQLVEALGVLDRTAVADEVKSLDQMARASLRKYGVRFGAYHIFLPALLKPGPRALGLMLWALKHGGLAQKGMDELPGLAASGRTSIAVRREIAKPLYRLVGYRVCDVRAVRVDILERLADLIRPALSWQPGAPGEKPAGAVDGRGFTVSVAMTSLVGCSGEDFASILRALGYRMDRRPPPPEAPALTPAEAVVASAPATEAQVEPQPSKPVAEAAPAPVSETAAAPQEPAMIEVWRPGRPAGARRRPHEHKPKPEPAQPSQTPQAPAAETREPRRQGRSDWQRRPFRGDRPRGKPREERPRERPIDPNSPFAALAELKARLEAERKNKS
jgi:ATP-dependent RNA helicase SUPV3L1/SUV3